MRQVAGSPWACGQCAFVPNVQTGCVLDPSSLGELSVIAETEAIVAYKVIMKAFGGLYFCRTLDQPQEGSYSWVLRPGTTLFNPFGFFT